jgi:isoleucyl-tRNA synthetase
MQADSHGRRSAQSAMYRILEALVRWLAPLLAFTAEEIWQHMPKTVATRVGAAAARGESVLFETWYEGLAATQASAQQRQFWSDLLEIRGAAAKLLERMRNEGLVGAALDAAVTVRAAPPLRTELDRVAGELRFFFIVSDVRLDDLAAGEGAAFAVEANVSADGKCIRCWHHRPDVGSVAEHPEICGRCVENLPDGPGENRQWF